MNVEALWRKGKWKKNSKANDKKPLSFYLSSTFHLRRLLLNFVSSFANRKKRRWVESFCSLELPSRMNNPNNPQIDESCSRNKFPFLLAFGKHSNVTMITPWASAIIHKLPLNHLSVSLQNRMKQQQQHFRFPFTPLPTHGFLHSKHKNLLW